MRDVDLESLQRQWDAFGQDDPLWAILGDPARRHGRWTPAEFFATGVEEIRGLMSRIDAMVPGAPRRRALDFGCGVGRLSQALCEHYETCDGVDIAPSMIDRARAFNRYGDRCHYHVNAADNLSLFENERFDLIYSNIVLQHLAPELFEGYIREFVRVLHPDGLAVFQLPDEQGALRGPAAARTHRPLPDDAFRAGLKPLDVPASAEGDVDLVIPVLVTNEGASPWPSSGETDGRLKVHLANHWADRRGRRIVADDGRGSLPRDLAPGESATIRLWVRTPTRSGRYVLELDMVQEGIAWFESRGSHVARVPITIAGRAISLAERFRSWLPKAREAADPTPADGSTKLLMRGARPQRVGAIVAQAGGRIVDIRGDGQKGEWPGYLYTIAKSASRAAVDVPAWIGLQEAAMMSARATIACGIGELVLAPGESTSIDVRIRNDSVVVWPRTTIRLGNHWLAADGATLVADDGRADLTYSLDPAHEMSVRLEIRAPGASGDYLLELDMVCEGVAWFQELGSQTTRVRVCVR